MRPESATLYAVSGLLLISVLCVGGRLYVNTQPAPGHASPGKPPKTFEPAADLVKSSLPKPVVRAGDSSPLVSQMRAIVALATSIDRTKALLELTAGFRREEDWKTALAVLEELSARRNPSLLDLILTAWTEADPQAAMNHAIESKSGMERVLAAWIASDPDGVLSYLASAEAKEKPEIWRTLVTTAGNLFGGDLPRLERLLKSIPEDERVRVLTYLKPKITAPLESIKPWVASLDPWMKDTVVRMLMQSQSDMKGRLAIAADFPEQIGPREQSLIYASWMKENEAEAMTAFEAMEPGPQHQAALGAAIMHYYQSARVKDALGLYQKWPEQVGQSFLSDLLLCERPEDAEVILAAIPLHQSESLRLNRYRVALEMWSQKDPEAARKWLEENEVPEIVRKEWEGK